MALPTWTVQAAFTTDPLDPSPVWEDLSDRLISFQSDRGKGDELGDFDAATATFVFNNEDGELTPANTSGTWSGMLLPNRLIRAKATWNAVDYWQFTGLIEAYEQIVSPGSPQLCSLRCVDGIKILNLERSPEFPDYPEEVERVLDPVWGYWRLNEPPSTRVKPGGWVKTKDNKDKGKKPQKRWRKRRRQRFLASASGPDAQVIGNPAFLQSTHDGGTGNGGPILGELTYGIGFDKGFNQHLRVPVPEADDRPGAEGCITVSVLVRPGQTSDSEEGILVGGPYVTAAGTPSWWLELAGQEAQFNVLVNPGVVVCATTGDAVPRDGRWHHIVATFRNDTGVAQIFVNGVREAVVDELSGGGAATAPLRRGDTGAPLFVAGHPTYSASTEFFTGMLAEVVVSEHKFPNEATNDAIVALADATAAGVGTPDDPSIAYSTGSAIIALLDGTANKAVTEFIQDPSYYNFGAGNTAIDDGETLVQPVRLDEPRLDILRRIEETENGMLFIDKEGILTFHDNTWLTGGGGATVFATLASDGVGIDFQGIAPATSDDMLYPVVTVLREGGTTQVAGDATQFFGQPLDLVDTLHISDEDALNLASILASRYGTARSRIYSLDLDCMSNDLLYPIVLGAELGNRVSVEHTYPDGTVETFDCRIIGIGRNSEGHLNTARWALCPSYVPDDGYWHLGVTGLSELGTSTKLA